MKNYRSKVGVLVLFSLLTGCAQYQEQQALTKEVSQLNQQMSQLNQQTLLLTRQNALNAQSKVGAYLIPGAGKGAVLNSQIGNLDLKLTDIQADGSGTRAMLVISAVDGRVLEPFSGTVEWGKLQGTTNHPVESNVQNQLFSVMDSRVRQSEASVPLHLNGLTPEQLDFVRIHDIIPLNSQP